MLPRNWKTKKMWKIIHPLLRFTIIALLFLFALNEIKRNNNSDDGLLLPYNIPFTKESYSMRASYMLIQANSNSISFNRNKKRRANAQNPQDQDFWYIIDPLELNKVLNGVKLIKMSISLDFFLKLRGSP